MIACRNMNVQAYFVSMKSLCFFLLMSNVAFAQTQEWHSVLKDSPKKEEGFNRSMKTILSAAAYDFSTLPRTLQSHEYLDTTWDVGVILPGADDAKLSKNNGASILTETFSFTADTGLARLLEKIKASLPDDYVYSLDYDPATETYDYTFDIDPTSGKKHLGYPGYIHLTGDKKTAFLFLGRSPAWLTAPK